MVSISRLVLTALAQLCQAYLHYRPFFSRGHFSDKTEVSPQRAHTGELYPKVTVNSHRQKRHDLFETIATFRTGIHDDISCQTPFLFLKFSEHTSSFSIAILKPHHIGFDLVSVDLFPPSSGASCKLINVLLNLKLKIEADKSV